MGVANRADISGRCRIRVLVAVLSVVACSPTARLVGSFGVPPAGPGGCVCPSSFADLADVCSRVAARLGRWALPCFKMLYTQRVGAA